MELRRCTLEQFKKFQQNDIFLTNQQNPAFLFKFQIFPPYSVKKLNCRPCMLEQTDLYLKLTRKALIK